MDRHGVLNKRLDELGITGRDLLTAVEAPPAGCVVAYCSALEGFGTALSDLDIYVVSPATAAAPGQPSRAVSLPHGDIALDIEYWPDDNLRSLMVRLSVCAPETLAAEGWSVLAPLKALYRVAQGVCLGGQEYHAEFCAGVPAHGIARVLSSYYLWRFDGDFEDAAALYDAGDYRSACLVAQRMLQAAAGVATSRRGRLVFHEKWLYRGLVQAYGPCHPVVERYWRLQTEFNQSDPARHVADMLDFAGQLTVTQELPAYGSA